MQVPLVEFISGRADINKEREWARRKIFRFKAGKLQTLAGIYWRRLSKEIKEAWKDRARFLNSRDIPGELKILPSVVTDAVILSSVNLEIDQLQRVFRQALLRQPKRDVSKYVRVFCIERVRMKTQTFRSFAMSLPLQLLIFGPNLSFMQDQEIISRTKKTVLIYIRSCKQIKDLFTVEGLCLLCVLEGGVEYTCAPKVFFTRSYEYVVNQVGDNTPGRTW